VLSAPTSPRSRLTLFAAAAAASERKHESFGVGRRYKAKEMEEDRTHEENMRALGQVLQHI
jgi:hypothetical protein